MASADTTSLDNPSSGCPEVNSTKLTAEPLYHRIDHHCKKILAKLNSLYSNFPQLLGLVLSFFALFVFIRSISATFRSWTMWSQKIDFFILHLPDKSIAWSVILAIMAGAVSRRKKIAWIILVTYFIFFFITNVMVLFRPVPRKKKIIPTRINTHPGIKNHDIIYNTHLVTFLIILCIQAGIILLLIFARKQFYAEIQKANLLLALLVFVIGICSSALIGSLLLIRIDTGYSRTEQFIILVNQSLGISQEFRTRESLLGDQYHYTLHVLFLLSFLGALTYIIALIVLLRSQRNYNAMTLSDETVVRRLNEFFGTNDSLSYYATRRDKAIIWAPNARAAITYRVEIGVCVASADPIGEEKSWPDAISAWLQLCYRYGWVPAVEGASALGATYYCQAGLKSWTLGDEALIYPDTFTLSGPLRKDVRQAVSRARRNGLSIRIRRQEELSYAELNHTTHCVEKWRHDEQERGFSMALGRLGDPADNNTLIVEALQQTDTGEKVVGILSFVPWGASGVSLDLMRRSPDTPNGTIEFMITELVLHAHEFGIHKISLNFVMLRKVFSEGPQLGSGPVLKIWYSILKYFSRFWQLETLYHSTSKFAPIWFPRYVCYPDTRAMVRVGFAIAAAEGFVHFPRFFGNKNLAKKHTGIYPQVPSTALAENFLSDVQQEQSKIYTPKRSNQVEVRLTKLNNALSQGIDPYPPATMPTHTIEQARNCSGSETITVAGRIMGVRSFGGVIFADLQDWSQRIQILLETPQVTTNFRTLIDTGDIVEVTGNVGYSKKGELSILVSQWQLAGKSLHPLPHKYKGLIDPETKVKLRHVDLLTSQEARETLTSRNAVIKSIRKTLDDAGFIEVETPILQTIHGGANAAPFITRSNAYHLDLSLRIAPELYLKRLLVGGVPKIYELGKQFRNEGVDSTHNPEFTSLEVYESYADYEAMKILTQKIISLAARSVHDTETLIYRDGNKKKSVDISTPWQTKSVLTALSETLGEKIHIDDPIKKLRDICKDHNITYNNMWDHGKLINRLYEQLVEKNTFYPTFYTDFPISVSPLTRNHRSTAGLAERWDLVIFGLEVATAYTELTDPIEQRKRLTEQSILAAHGDKESMQIDEDFLTALEYAMPPTGGLGIGIDRLIMLITGKSIRETLLFPLTR